MSAKLSQGLRIGLDTVHDRARERSEGARHGRMLTTMCLNAPASRLVRRGAKALIAPISKPVGRMPIEAQLGRPKKGR